MRPILAIEMEGVTPADLSGQQQPDFDLVDPRDLCVDETYQREIGPRSLAVIRRIYGQFRWAKFNAPICVRVDGRLHVINGQHTAIACASHPGITVIPVIVVDEPEKADRAMAFVSHAQNRVAVTPGQVWRAEVAAGNEEAVTIKQVCERAGITLLPYARPSSVFNPGDTIALAAIRSLINRRGARLAREVLSALAQAELAPVTGEMIKASEALLCENEYRLEFDANRLTLTIKSLGPRAISEAKELAAAKCLPMWRALTAVIYRSRKGRPPAAPLSTTSQGSDNKALEAKTASQVTTPPRVTQRSLIRPPEPAGYVSGDPPPGRSALDARALT